jgi:hypothetical protein
MPLRRGPALRGVHQMPIAVALLAPFAAPVHRIDLLADSSALLALIFGLGVTTLRDRKIFGGF